MLDYMTHQVLVYQSSLGSGREESLRLSLMRDLTLHIYSYPGRRHSLHEEDWSDFLLGFYGRIHDLLVNYRYQGPSFWGYLNKVLEWQLLSYYRQAARFRQAEWVCERESIIEYERSPVEQEYCLSQKMNHILSHPGLTPFRSSALRQRLLLLVLKNIVFIPEDEFASVFPLLGPDREEASEMRERLLSLMKRKFERKKRLETKRCENYSRLTLAEIRQSEETDVASVLRLDEKIILYKRRLKRLDRQLSRIPLYPSNEELSDLLGLPKGSVDSGLFYLKSYLEKRYGPGAASEVKVLFSPGLGCSCE